MQLLKVDDLVRVGRNYDGGYVISRFSVRDVDLLLSFGINDDWSFEKDMYRKFGIKCAAYDFSINRFTFFHRSLQNIKFFFGDLLKRRTLSFQRFSDVFANYLLWWNFNYFFRKHQFFSIGLDNKTHDNFYCLRDILTKHGCKNIFLKIDIEGYEYKVIQDIVDHSEYFKAIVMEIHEIHRRVTEFEQMLADLNEKYFIYHIHANNYGSVEKKNNYPDVVEISCIRKDLVHNPTFTSGLSHLPLNGVDFPNNSATPDFKWAI